MSHEERAKSTEKRLFSIEHGVILGMGGSSQNSNLRTFMLATLNLHPRAGGAIFLASGFTFDPTWSKRGKMASIERYHHGPAEYHFCPRCGASLELRVVKTNEPKRLVCRKCSFIFYLDPKLVAGTIFTLEGRVVLIKRGIEPSMGKWVFPGGYVDRGETVKDAAIRETKEECALDVRLGSLLGVYSYPYTTSVIVVYAAEIVGGELKAGDETVEARAFESSDIPWEELGFESTRDALQDYLKPISSPSEHRP